MLLAMIMKAIHSGYCGFLPRFFVAYWSGLLRMHACFLGWLTNACLSALLWLPVPLICGFLIRLTAACLSALLWLPAPLICNLLIRAAYYTLLRQAYCRLFVSLTASCPASLWLTDQAYCMLLRMAYWRLFVSLTVASFPAYLWLTDQA